MNNATVISSLTGNGFYFVGDISDLDLDYFELIDGEWFLGVICSENMIIAFSQSIGWGYDSHGKSDNEDRWNTTKKLIRQALKPFPIAA